MHASKPLAPAPLGNLQQQIARLLNTGAGRGISGLACAAVPQSWSLLRLFHPVLVRDPTAACWTAICGCWCLLAAVQMRQNAHCCQDCCVVGLPAEPAESAVLCLPQAGGVHGLLPLLLLLHQASICNIYPATGCWFCA